MRKALIVGIDYYANQPQLKGCVRDAASMHGVLETHENEDPNFDVKLNVAADKWSAIEKADLESQIIELFSGDPEVALLYFAGHGRIQADNGFLVTSDFFPTDQGVSMDWIVDCANSSAARNKIIILDCCHSGELGNLEGSQGYSVLSEGMTILAASEKNQYSVEEHGMGVFTSLLIDALHGGAANIVGEVTAGSVYNYIDQSLGSWEQRPVYKTNIKQFIPLRKTNPMLPYADLRKITSLFKHPDDKFPLDPSYEKSSDNPNSENIAKFEILQKYNRVGIVVPLEVAHMYYAAKDSKSCKLTPLGKHYWRLASKKRI